MKYKRGSKNQDEFGANICVVGVGGSGGNAINHMADKKVKGVKLIAINTDVQDLNKSKANIKINIGKNATQGLGTGMNPDLGRMAAEEEKEEIKDVLKDFDMIFVACGMGGGTGTGATPVVSRIAKELDSLVVAVVTKPFSFEGKHRKNLADGGIEALSKEVDSYIVIPNDRILEMVDDRTSMRNAFALCDDILYRAVSGISDLITTPGIINVDFADVKTIMSDSSLSLIGIGNGKGSLRGEMAAQDAISSPLIETDINGAKRIIFSIASKTKTDLTMNEIQTAAEIITNAVDTDARIIPGATVDSKLKKGEIRITVIATDFIGKGDLSQFTTFVRSTNNKDKDENASNQVIRIGSIKNKGQKEDIKKVEDKDNDNDDDDKWLPSFLKI